MEKVNFVEPFFNLNQAYLKVKQKTKRFFTVTATLSDRS